MLKKNIFAYERKKKWKNKRKIFASSAFPQFFDIFSWNSNFSHKVEQNHGPYSTSKVFISRKEEIPFIDEELHLMFSNAINEILS